MNSIFLIASATLQFNGSQMVQMSGDKEKRTQAEDITLRFRTNRPVGLLLTTWSPVSSDRLELALLSGRIRLLVQLGDREVVSGSQYIKTVIYTVYIIKDIKFLKIILYSNKYNQALIFIYSIMF